MERYSERVIGGDGTDGGSVSDWGDDLGLGSEQGHGIPYGIYDFPWSRSENPDHVTGNIRVLSSEALVLDNISNKVQVQMSCFLNVSGNRVRCPDHGS